MKPLLAATVEDEAKLVFPLMVSPKLDGIRCLIVGGRPMSRNMKDIQNKHIWHALFDMKLPDLDGELIVGDPKASDVFNRTSSGVMSRDGSPKFAYYVFDRHDKHADSFRQRLTDVSGIVRDKGGVLRIVAHKDVRTLEELRRYETQMLIAGYEGVMLRDPRGVYKFGRSTLREAILMKLKRFTDSEAKVLDIVEQMHNGNEATADELGRSKRSSAKAGKTGKGTMGALKVRCKPFDDFEVGTGWSDAERQDIWDNWPRDKGRMLKFKYQAVGVLDKPRFPVALGWRHVADL